MGNLKPLPESFLQGIPLSLEDYTNRLSQIHENENLRLAQAQQRTATYQMLAQANAISQAQSNTISGLADNPELDWNSGYKLAQPKPEGFYTFHSEMERERSKPKKVPVEWRFIIVASILGYLICELIKGVIF